MMQIHVINLPHRSDRKEVLLAEFAKHDITGYTFANAVSGSLLDIDFMEKDGLVSFSHRRLTRGEYGCYMSHLGVLTTILESSDDLHLILEDDVYFVDDFNFKLKEILTKVQNVDWDIFYLGINCKYNKCKRGKFVGKRSDGIYFPKYPIWGTHAYLIKKTAVQKIYHKLMPIILPIDVRLMYLPELNKLTLIDTIIKAYFNDSDTQGIR